MKGEKVWVLGTLGDDGVVIVVDALTDQEVWLPESGARTVEVEVKNRTVKRKEVPATLVERKGKYDKVRMANGAVIHVKRQEAVA